MLNRYEIPSNNMSAETQRHSLPGNSGNSSVIELCGRTPHDSGAVHVASFCGPALGRIDDARGEAVSHGATG